MWQRIWSSDRPALLILRNTEVSRLAVSFEKKTAFRERRDATLSPSGPIVAARVNETKGTKGELAKAKPAFIPLRTSYIRHDF